MVGVNIRNSALRWTIVRRLGFNPTETIKELKILHKINLKNNNVGLHFIPPNLQTCDIDNCVNEIILK